MPFFCFLPSFHAGVSMTRSGMNGFDLLPRDVFRKILVATDQSPVRFAGVCRSWRWVLDDVDVRRYISFRYNRNYRFTLHEAARSLALFVCRRPPVTETLDVFVGHGSAEDHAPEARTANAALGVVLTHLAPRLLDVTLEPFATADAFTTSPFTGACRTCRACRS